MSTNPHARSTTERWPATAERPEVVIHRSARRRRSASARFAGEQIVVRVPAGLSMDEELELVTTVVGKVVRRFRASRRLDDAALQRRATELAARYLDGPGGVDPTTVVSVSWSDRMATRHGSCSTGSGRIRIATQLASHPDYVLDAVLVHELAHLIHPDHSVRFHELADRYPHQQRARGYLEGYEAGRFTRLLEPGDAAVDEAADEESQDR